MATKTTVLLVDDIDGGTADETIEFSVDGTSYEIDLKAENADKLRQAFEVYMNCGRRVGGRARIAAPAGKTVKKGKKAGHEGYSVGERHAMQRFAAANDLTPPADRGRIAEVISHAWEEAGRPM